MAKSSGYTEETLKLSMTAKQPPSYDGNVSWFEDEECVASVASLRSDGWILDGYEEFMVMRLQHLMGVVL